SHRPSLRWWVSSVRAPSAATTQAEAVKWPARRSRRNGSAGSMAGASPNSASNSATTGASSGQRWRYSASAVARELSVGIASRLLAGPVAPERGVADAQRFRIEAERATGLALPLVVAQRRQCGLLQDHDRDQVQPRPQADADVAEAPGGAG